MALRRSQSRRRPSCCRCWFCASIHWPASAGHPVKRPFMPLCKLNAEEQTLGWWKTGWSLYIDDFLNLSHLITYKLKYINLNNYCTSTCSTRYFMILFAFECYCFQQCPGCSIEPVDFGRRQANQPCRGAGRSWIL